MTKHLQILTLLLLTLNLSAQNLEDQIKDLHTKTQIDSLWKNIHEIDQKNRGDATNDSIDNLNFKKNILMIKHHGYPVGNRTPNVVFVHQRSNFVCEYYFPIFKEAFLTAKADTFWFLHNVKRLHRGRFNRDYLQPKVENYNLVLERMAPYLNTEIDYSIEPFDSLYDTYIQTIESIVVSEVLGHWKTEYYGDYNLIIYKLEDKYFLEKRWARSVVLPQEVVYNSELKKYTHKEKCCGVEYILDKDGNISQYTNGVLKNTFTPISTK